MSVTHAHTYTLTHMEAIPTATCTSSEGDIEHLLAEDAKLNKLHITNTHTELQLLLAALAVKEILNTSSPYAQQRMQN